MTAVATSDSSNITAIRNSGDGLSKNVFAYIAFAVKSVSHTNDVFVKIIDNDLTVDLSDRDLTILGMKSSEKVLNKVWDNEDDDYWNSFL